MDILPGLFKVKQVKNQIFKIERDVCLRETEVGSSPSVFCLPPACSWVGGRNVVVMSCFLLDKGTRLGWGVRQKERTGWGTCAQFW